MTTLSLGHSFTVNQIAGVTTTTDAYLNIQKRKGEIVYRANTSATNVNLAFVRGITINSDTNIGINDRSYGLLENREVDQLQPLIFRSVSGFTSNAEKLLITDVFTSDVPTLPATPLFFQHALQVALESGDAYQNVQILDSLFNKISVSQLSIDYTNGIVYNNLENVFSLQTGLFVVYYLEYEVVSGGNVTKYREILNNSNVYRPATFEDLDVDNNIIPGSKVFVITENVVSGLFDVTLPTVSTYAVKNEPGARLSVVHPPSTDTENPWFVSVTNGKFISSVKTSVTDTSIFKYYIPEFLGQSFAPYAPYKLVTDESSYRLQGRLVKTIKSQVVSDSIEVLYPEVYVYRQDGSFKFAISDNPLKWDTPSEETTNFAPVGFESVDRRNGFLVLPTGYEISERDTVLSTYHYIEDEYQFTLFDLNPLSNTDLLSKMLVLLIAPEAAGLTITKSLYYLLVDEDGVIEDSDWGGIGDDYVDFLADHTVQGDPNTDALLILAEVFVRENSSPESLAILDIRVRGGGIKDNLLEEAKDIAPEVCWSSDAAPIDGTPYPGAASYFIEIPYDVLSEFGGRFTPEQVRGIVKRHTAAGIYPVIWKYSKYEPVITDIEYTEDGTIIQWTQGPTDALFNIYTAPVSNGPWTLVVEDLANNVSGNTYTLNLVPDLYVVVAGHNGSTEPCFGGPINV